MLFLSLTKIQEYNITCAIEFSPYKENYWNTSKDLHSQELSLITYLTKFVVRLTLKMYKPTHILGYE